MHRGERSPFFFLPAPDEVAGRCSACRAYATKSAARRLESGNLLCGACAAQLDIFARDRGRDDYDEPEERHRVATPKEVEAPLLPDGSRRIPLTTGSSAFVDDADYSRVKTHRWFPTNGYAAARMLGKQVYLQRYVVRCPIELRVGFRDLDPMNCRRANLMIGTPSQVLANQPIDNSNTSGFKGIDGEAQRWLARPWMPGSSKRLSFGPFKTPEAAAIAYDSFMRMYLGDFARYNFPRPGERTARSGITQEGASQPRPEEQALLVDDVFAWGGEMLSKPCGCCGRLVAVPVQAEEEARDQFGTVV